MAGRIAMELQHVRAHYVPRSLNCEGVTWTYLSGGSGDETLLLLPGGPGRAETSFQYIAAFESRYRILAPDYPPAARTVAALVDGLAALLKVEQAQEVHVVGGSYSGLIAQCVIRRQDWPQGMLVLADTGLPRPERARRHRWYRAVIALLPMALTRSLLWLGTYLYVREVDAERGFWQAYLHDLVRSLTKVELLHRFEAWIDFDLNYRFDREHVEQALLIIEAEHDPLFRAAERAALRALYPSAKTHLFVGGGHAASLARAEEYIAVIEAFLGRQMLNAGKH